MPERLRVRQINADLKGQLDDHPTALFDSLYKCLTYDLYLHALGAAVVSVKGSGELWIPEY